MSLLIAKLSLKRFVACKKSKFKFQWILIWLHFSFSWLVK